MQPKRIRKQNKKSYDCVLELNFATINGLGEPRKLYNLLLMTFAYSSANYLFHRFLWSSSALSFQQRWNVGDRLGGGGGAVEQVIIRFWIY
jgi:hypothetical protein